MLMIHSPVATWLSSDHEKRELCGNMAALFVEGVPVSVPSAADNPDFRGVVSFLLWCSLCLGLNWFLFVWTLSIRGRAL